MAQMTPTSTAPRAAPPHPAADRRPGAPEGQRLRADAAREHTARAAVPLLRPWGHRVLRRTLPRWPGLRRRALLPLQHGRRDLVRVGCQRRAARDRTDHGAAEPSRRQQLPARSRVARQLPSRDDRAATERHGGPDREAHLAVHEVPRASVRARVHRSSDRRPRRALPRVPHAEPISRTGRSLQRRRVTPHLQRVRSCQPAVPDGRVGMGQVVDASADGERRARRCSRRPLESQATV